MSRTRKTNTQAIEDAFFDLDPQAMREVLHTLETLMRLRERQEGRTKKAVTEAIAEPGAAGVTA